jgi:branched-chain amino acid transport system ATP-binding protein
VTDPTPLLEIENVTVRFGGLTAVNNVSFQVRAGEICALIGPNGAGKTTLFNAVSGNVIIGNGTIRLSGKPIHNLPPHVISSRGVRRTFQNGGLFGDLTALENVLVGLHATTPSNLLGLLLGTRASVRAETQATLRAHELLALFDIDHLSNQLVRSLSGGQQRMVEIVRTLATDPPLLLLDEPAVGLSPPMRIQLGAVVQKLASERGIAILLIEHAIELVMNVSDRVVVMSEGRKVADAPPREIRADRSVLEAYLGHA